jgi:ABC-type branched-subunit amino acid transport system substrate-binding protein
MRTRRWLVAVVAIGALLAAGCSSDRGEDESGGADAGATDTTEAAAGGAGDFGDLTGVCGPNEGGGAVPDAGPDEIQGVTEDQLVLGTVADPGFEGRPGLTQELFDAGEAFVAWCNAAGGINGRELVLNQHDAAITQYQQAITDACATDFAIVGGGGTVDDTWPDVGAGCGLIDIAGYSVTPAKAGTAGQDLTVNRSVQPVPNPSDLYQVGSYAILDQEFPDAGARTGVIYGDLETTAQVADRFLQGTEALGHTTVHESAYNILGEANWAPFAAALQEDEVQYLQFVGEGENLALLLQAMDEVGYRPEVIVQDANFYDPNWIEAAGPAAEGVFVRTVFWPFEEADANPATAQYVEQVEAVDGKVALLGAQSWSGWLLFAQAAAECDRADDLTRSCVLETSAAVDEWTGGGLHAPTDPSANEPASCTLVLRVEDGAFVRHAPEGEGYECGEDFDEPFLVDVDVT